jgi:hypothetical protein
MPKPTLLQSVLGRPSQTYAFPSARCDLSRTAATSRTSLPTAISNASLGNFVEYSPKGKPCRDLTSSPRQQITSSALNSTDSDSDNSGHEIFYTPLSSPPTSMFIPPDVVSLHPSDDKSSSSSTSSSHSALSCSTPPTSDELHSAFATSSKQILAPSRPKRISTEPKSYTYTDEDWAKEFRWLVQPPTSPNSTPKRRASVNVLQPAPIPRPRSRTLASRPNTTHRMAALLEEDEDIMDDHRVSTTPSHTRGPFPAPLSRSSLIADPANSHDIRPTSQASHTRTISLSSRTVELPQFPTTAAPPPAPGYTSLTLPRASYRRGDPWRTLGSGHIDLPRDGRAQLTMVSIEVVRGVASASFLPSSFRRRDSAPRPHQKHDLSGALALTSHRPPPSFVPNSDVLVHVHAVGLEGLDRQIILDKLAASEAGGKRATGFVPGRGFLGRVLECGLEVSRNTLKKGEWVIGLLDAKKVR